MSNTKKTSKKSAAPKATAPGVEMYATAKPIHSADPRKEAIVQSLKFKSGCGKVTQVKQVGPHTFEGNCMNPRGGDSNVGVNYVTLNAMPEVAHATPPKKSPALVIEDACAAPGCIRPPSGTFEGAGYCAEHLEAVTKADAKVAQLVAEQQAKVHSFLEKPQPKKAKAEREALNAQVLEQAKAPKKAKADPKPAPAKEAPRGPTRAAPKATLSEARAIIASLQADGWTLKSIAEALGTSPGRVWFWAHGKNCRRVEDLRALRGGKAPATKAAAGSIKAKAEPKAPRRAVPTEDPRQLRLRIEGLRDTLNTILGTR